MHMTFRSGEDVAIIAIGRNEGERLKSCLRTVVPGAKLVVYVDSGSVDGSPQYAASVGCHVVELDPTRPFSAARAATRDLHMSCNRHPTYHSFSFSMATAIWLRAGWTMDWPHLIKGRTWASSAGMCAAPYPEASVYNKLYNLEWQQTPGEIRSSGGDF